MIRKIFSLLSILVFIVFLFITGCDNKSDRVPESDSPEYDSLKMVKEKKNREIDSLRKELDSLKIIRDSLNNINN